MRFYILSMVIKVWINKYNKKCKYARQVSTWTRSQHQIKLIHFLNQSFLYQVWFSHAQITFKHLRKSKRTNKKKTAQSNIKKWRETRTKYDQWIKPWLKWKNQLGVGCILLSELSLEEEEQTWQAWQGRYDKKRKKTPNIRDISWFKILIFVFHQINIMN